jgi:ligand-binding SRPBCC domain-containing protein
MRYSFKSEQWLPYSADFVFAFFADPANLPPLLPVWQNARIEEAAIVAPPPRKGTPAQRMPGIAAGKGSTITLSFRPFPYSPLRLPWEAEIAEFVWNERFRDLQLRGPFAYWSHTHRFQPQTPSGTRTPGTLLLDEIEYEMPLGALGRFAQDIFIARQVREAFSYRRKRTGELMAGLASAMAKFGRR